MMLADEDDDEDEGRNKFEADDEEVNQIGMDEDNVMSDDNMSGKSSSVNSVE